MRFPNGYGSVYKLSGKRRRPYIVRITKGWTEDNKQLYETVGYYASRPEAILALADYNKNPYKIDTASITYAEVYERLMERKIDKISDSNIKGYKAAFKITQPIHDMRFVEIRTDHMQDIIDDCGKGYETLRKVKILYNQLYDYAMEHDIVTKNYSEYVKLPANNEESDRKPFTDQEVKLLWDNVEGIEYLDTILIMIYTGLRIGELLLIKNADIHLDERYMRGGIKTKAGKNRIIPINRKIENFIQNRMSDNEYLILNNFGRQMQYDNYYQDNWKKIMNLLGMDHTPHSCRHTFATLMDNAGANNLSRKRIMGHAAQDITDKVYTHKDIEELIKAIDLI